MRLLTVQPPSSISQVPSLTPANEHNTPLESIPGSFDSNNLSDLMLTVRPFLLCVS